jgi:uncharacterized protein YndB with AHSA1/START domain
MTIAPIIQSVTVRAPPARAFDLFTSRMNQWWPARATIGKNPFVSIVLEPGAGGQWFERDAEGTETKWGKVLAWDPPERVLLAWQINSQFTYDTDFVTEVEISFTPTAQGGTTVTLEHRNLERFGADAERIAGLLGGGWPRHMADYAQFADSQT